MLVKQSVWPGERLPVYWLRDQLTLGSHPSCDVALPGLRPVHARISRADGDWVLRAVAGVTKVLGVPVVAHVLESGARIELGGHQLAFLAGDHVEHVRPHDSIA